MKDWNKEVHFYENLWAVEKNGKWGFAQCCDGQWTLLQDYVWDEVFPLSEGFARVRQGDKYTFVNRNGSCAFGRQRWLQAMDFSQGRAWVKSTIIIDGRGSWDLLSAGGEYLELQPWEEKKGPNCALTAVRKYGRWGVLRWNWLVLPCIYDYIRILTPDLLAVEKNRRWGAVDLAGNTIVPCQWYDVTVMDGLIQVQKESKYGLLDRSGRELTPCQWDTIVDSSEHGVPLRVDKDGKWGLLNHQGNLIAPCEWDRIDRYHKGYFTVYRNGKQGLLDTNGKLVIPCEWEDAKHVCSGMVPVCRDGKWGLVNTDGETVIPCTWENLSIHTLKGSLTIVVRQNRKWGQIDLQGNVVQPFLWDSQLLVGNYEALKEKKSTVPVPVCRDGKWGYTDADGNEVISCQWEDAVEFQEGCAYVKKDGFWQEIDEQGCLRELRVVSKSGIQEGRCIIKIHQRPGFRYTTERYALADRQGRLLTPPRWFFIGDFSEGLARVRDQYRYGYMDRDGNLLTPVQWESAWDFSEGFAPVKKDGKWQFLDKTGKVYPQLWESAYPFRNGFAGVKQDGKWGFVDAAMQLVIPCIWDYAYYFQDGLAMVNKDHKYGYIDRSGQLVFPCRWTMAGTFYKDHAWVQEDGKDILIHRSGREVGRYDNHLGLVNGRCPVYKDGKWGYIDARGNEITPCIWDDADVCCEHCLPVEKDGKWGYLDFWGKEITPCIWDEIRPFQERMAAVRQGDLWAYIDRSGKQLTPLMFTKAGSCRRGKASAWLHNLKVEVANNGTLVWLGDHCNAFGFADIKQEGKYGLLDWNTKQVLTPCVWDTLLLRYLHRTGRRRGYWEPFDAYYQECDVVGFIVRKEGLWGLLGVDGKQLLPCRYDSIGHVGKDRMVAALFGKQGVVSHSGEVLIPFRYDDIQLEFDAQQNVCGYRVREKGRTFCLNISGEEME